jgi:DNA-binding protein H-NS
MADRLASIRKQIAALEKRASELMRAENKKVIDRVKALIEKHRITAEDLGFAGAGNRVAKSADDGAGKPARKTRGAKRAVARKKGAATVGVPMYRDPKSGKTWTGRGKPPNWIAKAKDRSAFLISNGASAGADAVESAAAAPAKGRKPKAGKKAAPKTTAKRAAKVPAAPKPVKAAKPVKAGKKVASKRSAKSPGKTAPPPPAPAAEATAEA